MFQDNKGITLVILIITVIIMIILAGIIISTTIDSKMVDTARNMQQDTNDVIDAQKSFENLVLKDMPHTDEEE